MSGTNGAIKLVAGDNPRLTEAIGAYLRIPLTMPWCGALPILEIFVET